MLSISVTELKQKLRNGEDFLLVDVREPWEHQLFNIGGLNIPMQEIAEKAELIDQDKPVVFYCEKGIRSQLVIQKLLRKFHYSNLLNLAGGMEAWKKDL